MGEPVEERTGEPLRAEHGCPFVERQVAGDQDRAPLVAPATPTIKLSSCILVTSNACGSSRSHHPLAGQRVAVVRRKRHQGEPHLVIEGPDGGRQLLPARCVEPAGTVALATGSAARLHPRQPAAAGQPGRHLAEHPVPRSGGPPCSPAPSPHPPLWSTFRPETHRQLVELWTDLLQRQIPILQGRIAEPREAVP